MKYFAEIEDHIYEIVLLDENRISSNGELLTFDMQQGSKPEHFSLLIDGKSHQVWIERVNEEKPGMVPTLRVHIYGFEYDVKVEDERKKQLRQYVSSDSDAEDLGKVTAPMPGLVVKLLAEPGQKINKGDGVMIVEAMKMENEIRSPLTGEVKEIRVTEKQAVEKNEVLAVIG